MSRLLDAMRYDASRVVCNPAESGEPAVHVAADGTETRLVATWGAPALQDLGQGFVGDLSEVIVPRAQLRSVRRKDKLRRHPDLFDALLLEDGWALLLEEGGELGLEASAAESWTVDDVREDVGLWILACTLNPRPLPRAQ